MTDLSPSFLCSARDVIYSEQPCLSQLPSTPSACFRILIYLGGITKSENFDFRSDLRGNMESFNSQPLPFYRKLFPMEISLYHHISRVVYTFYNKRGAKRSQNS